MFKITPITENRLDIEINGKLDTQAMKQALDALVDAAQDYENGKMLYTISDFKLPSLGAIAVEFSRLPELFRLIKKFDRAAVLADRQWIKHASEIEGALIPGLEIRAFDAEQKAQAEAWLMR